MRPTAVAVRDPPKQPLTANGLATPGLPTARSSSAGQRRIGNRTGIQEYARRVGRNSMANKIAGSLLAILVFASVQLAHAQAAKVYRVGVIHEGGPSYNAMVDGLKDGLGELGLTEGKQYILNIRDVKGDPKAVEAAARSLEHEKVDLIYVLGTSVSTAVKRATTAVPIVFAVGTDPVTARLIESFARPGGRITGVYYSVVELTAKRLEILKAILPDLRRVV